MVLNWILKPFFIILFFFSFLCLYFTLPQFRCVISFFFFFQLLEGINLFMGLVWLGLNYIDNYHSGNFFLKKKLEIFDDNFEFFVHYEFFFFFISGYFFIFICPPPFLLPFPFLIPLVLGFYLFIKTNNKRVLLWFV